MPATTRRRNLWGAVAVVVVLLSACNGRESVTGGYGRGVVTGTVTMAAGVSNRSPAGVRLSGAGTGATMGLGPAGPLLFSAVPERAALRIPREDVIAAGTNV